MADLQERLNLQTKELQDALSQRKLAMSEYSEVSDKYVDVLFSVLVLVDGELLVAQYGLILVWQNVDLSFVF